MEKYIRKPMFFCGEVMMDLWGIVGDTVWGTEDGIVVGNVAGIVVGNVLGNDVGIVDVLGNAETHGRASLLNPEYSKTNFNPFKISL